MDKIVDLLLERAESQPERPALIVKRRSGERANGRASDRIASVSDTPDGYAALTWSEIGRDVRRYALAFLELGIRPGDRVAQLSENRYEWLVCDLALQCIGAVHVPLHASLTGAQIVFQVRHSGASVLLLSDTQQAAKLVEADWPDTVVRCLSFDSCDSPAGGRPIEWLREYLPDETGEEKIDGRRKFTLPNVSANDLATILYTSGTTGQPRGVLLTHGNLVFNATSMARSSGQQETDVKLNFLPLSHIYARTSDFYTWIVCGNQLALAEDRKTVLDDCAATGPTWINAVPYFYDKVRRQVQDPESELYGRPLQDVFGGRIRVLHSGGAPISTGTADFYQSRGLPLYQGYGLTETSPVITTSCPGQSKPGSVGRPIRGVEVRIAEDGEILTRGPHVMAGYWRDDRATNQAIRGGWFHTGDIGHLDQDGFLTITGRKKEILVTTGGKNVAPAAIETRLGEDPLIGQVIVLGDGRDYLIALIVPDVDALDAALGSGDAERNRRANRLSDPQVAGLFRRRIAERLADLSHYERVQKFLLLDKPFSVERGELTLKHSLRRDVIEQHYAREIDSLY